MGKHLENLRHNGRDWIVRSCPSYAARVFARRFLKADDSFMVGIDLEKRGLTLQPLSNGAFLVQPKTRHASPKARVLIAPGHNGQYRQFVRLITTLNKLDIEVSTIVYPGHLTVGSVCGFGLITQALIEAASTHGPFDALVGHCIGTNAALNALGEGCDFDKLALLSTPAHLPGLVAFSGKQYGLSGKTLDQFVDRVSALGAPFPLDHPWQPLLANHKGQTLLVHASDDYAALLPDTEAMHELWPGSELKIVANSGHNEILLSKRAIGHVADFLTQ